MTAQRTLLDPVAERVSLVALGVCADIRATLAQRTLALSG
jgi:hypothetical protein